MQQSKRLLNYPVNTHFKTTTNKLRRSVMYYRTLQFFLILFLISSLGYAQTLVIPGENALSEAVTAAADGDVLQLIAGGDYTETGKTVGNLDKNITIEMENYDPNSTKPVVRFTADDGTDNAFFYLLDGASISVKGVEFHGDVDGTIQVQYFLQADVTDSPVQTTISKIKIEDCYIHHLTDNMIDAGNSSMKTFVLFDTTIVHNTIGHDFATSLYYKYSGENYIEVKNSTFYKLTSYGMRIAGPGESGDFDHTPTGVVDGTTWYDIGSLDGREIILIEKGPNLNPWTVTNSIFQKQHNLSKVVINLKDLPDNISTVSNISYWDVGDRNWRNNNIADTLLADPQFVDPDNGDFTLPTGSPLYTFGTDGGAIGDPRWATNPPTSVREENAIPEGFKLSQNYPNPFNPTTQINFGIQAEGFTTLKVYDLLGREVSTLLSENLNAGVYNIDFDAELLPSGVYLYQLTSGNQTISKKMILNK